MIKQHFTGSAAPFLWAEFIKITKSIPKENSQTFHKSTLLIFPIGVSQAFSAWNLFLKTHGHLLEVAHSQQSLKSFPVPSVVSQFPLQDSLLDPIQSLKPLPTKISHSSFTYAVSLPKCPLSLCRLLLFFVGKSASPYPADSSH